VMIATSFLDLFKQESNEVKKTLLLQLFNLIKYLMLRRSLNELM